MIVGICCLDVFLFNSWLYQMSVLSCSRLVFKQTAKCVSHVLMSSGLFNVQMYVWVQTPRSEAETQPTIPEK